MNRRSYYEAARVAVVTKQAGESTVREIDPQQPSSAPMVSTEEGPLPDLEDLAAALGDDLHSEPDVDAAELLDVDLPSAQDGTYLTYSGDRWVSGEYTARCVAPLGKITGTATFWTINVGGVLDCALPPPEDTLGRTLVPLCP